jgi:hypothetical protein
MIGRVVFIKILTSVTMFAQSFLYGGQLNGNYVSQIQKMIIDKPPASSSLRVERVTGHDYFDNFKLEIGLVQEKPTYVFVSPSPPYILPTLYAKSVKEGKSVYNFLDAQNEFLASFTWGKSENNSYALLKGPEEDSKNKMIFIHSLHRNESVTEHWVFFFKNSSFEVSHHFKVTVYQGNETQAYFQPGELHLPIEANKALSEKDRKSAYNQYLFYKEILKSKYIPFLEGKGVIVGSYHDDKAASYGNFLTASFVCGASLILYYLSRGQYD